MGPKLVCGEGHLGCFETELLNKIRAESGDLFASHMADSSEWDTGCSMHEGDGRCVSGVETVITHEVGLVNDNFNISSCRAFKGGTVFMHRSPLLNMASATTGRDPGARS